MKEKELKFSNGENKVVTLSVKHFSLYAVTFKVVASETSSNANYSATPATPTTPATQQHLLLSSSSSSAAQGENKPAPAPAAGDKKHYQIQG